MLKVLILHLFLINGYRLYSPRVTFQLFVQDQQSGEVKKFSLYSLVSEFGHYIPTDSDLLVVPDTGVYQIAFFGEEKVYHFDKFEYYSDTLLLPFITECYIQDKFSGYCCGEGKCNGAQIDYYTNGNIRAKGEFREGLPIGKLKFYNSDGSLQRMVKFNSKGRKVKEQDY